MTTEVSVIERAQLALRGTVTEQNSNSRHNVFAVIGDRRVPLKHFAAERGITYSTMRRWVAAGTRYVGGVHFSIRRSR